MRQNKRKRNQCDTKAKGNIEEMLKQQRNRHKQGAELLNDRARVYQIQYHPRYNWYQVRHLSLLTQLHD